MNEKKLKLRIQSLVYQVSSFKMEIGIKKELLKDLEKKLEADKKELHKLNQKKGGIDNEN